MVSMRILGTGVALAALVSCLSGAEPLGARELLAKVLFGAERLPTAGRPEAIGFYSKGCQTGAVELPADGPHWQVMRPSRNRAWGQPAMIRVIERLSRDAAKAGWPGLLVGDIAQPRGGPMVDGHASHQIGLDADIWFTPMPGRRLTRAERDTMPQTSVLKRDSLYVDDARWTPAYEALLKTAASYPEVERILVHPGIKKKLCDTVHGDRSWLRKVRPFWGHFEHFHMRIGCQPGSPLCKEQAPPPPGDGCDAKSLAWWFTDAPWRPAKKPAPPKPRDVMTLAALPSACRAVLDAPAAGAQTVAATSGRDTSETEAEAPPVAESAYAPALDMLVPVPAPRPATHAR